jgi:hypothetical protein
MLPENLSHTYNAFFEATADNSVFSKRTTIMIQLAASLALGCYP